MQTIILASGSPRRKELLEAAGVNFIIKTIDTDETTSLTDPKEVVKELSSRKARAVWRTLPPLSEKEAVVIGADTIVSYNGEILGKPRDKEDALRMLRLLSGNTHQVYTGVSIYARQDPKEEVPLLQFAEETLVTCYPLSQEVLLRYIATGEPMDKAGAYGIQGLFGLFIQEIKGDIQNVIGLPVPRLLQEATRAGLSLSPWQGGIQ